MRKSLLSVAAASMFLAGVGIAAAQSTTSTTSESWTTGQGKSFSDYSTSKKYNSYSDPKFKATMGEEAPSGMTLHEIPDSMKLHSADRYRYGMINDHPVVVEQSSHKIVHSWD
jgi:hypothetical protein